jgi:hypothetical protein
MDEPNDNDLVPERFRIQDLEGWLINNGLRGPDDDVPDRGNVERDEETARVEEYARYARSIHDEAFKDTEAEHEQKHEDQRKRLKTMRCCFIDLRAADGVIPGLPLNRLAESCDTILAMANSWDTFSPEETVMHFSLENFPKSSVQEFVNVLFDDSKTAENISSCAIVDCCLIAHYLCAAKMLEEITEILIASIDTANCLSLCQLADELNLPILFERSLAHMMDSIGDLENNEAWGDLTPGLRDRIAAIKTAIESSIHARSRLYFASLDEYISIFAERVQYYRERLAEAKEQQERTRHGTPAWIDTQAKINRQEQRVRTLEIALSEQKKLFRPTRNREALI